MDREGFLLNTAYREMVEVVRGGLEYLAKLDKARQLAAFEAKSEQTRLALRSDLAKTAAALRADPRLAPEEKAALVQHYSELALRVTQQESYDQLARQRLEIASGLGVVAGFMTHEAERLFLSLDGVLGDLSSYAGKIPRLKEHLKQVHDSRQQLDGYIRYNALVHRLTAHQ